MLVYGFVRYFPATNFQAPRFLRQWTRGRELDRLETAADQIGNPHQFVMWGDALREVGCWDQAESAYSRALAKDPQNLQALWGRAQVAEHSGEFAEMERCTRSILDKDPQYKFGDVSLAYGKALAAGGQPEAAQEHLEQHIKRWRHPEALYQLAVLCRDAGEPDAARQHLRAAPAGPERQPHRDRPPAWPLRSRAWQMLRKLPPQP
ncbi:MAG: tetratricopeptide repeat protein [Planctomycetaceae bacterium]